MKLKLKGKKQYTLNPLTKIGLLGVLIIIAVIVIISIFDYQGIKNFFSSLVTGNNIATDNYDKTKTYQNIISLTPEVIDSITPTITPTITLTITNTPKPTNTIKPTNTKTPTPTIALSPGQVGPNCPISTQNCVPCLIGELYCRVESGKTTGFKGWACQNNNPGNIRPASFKNDLIRNNGGTPPCGERSGYMVFKDYNTGKIALKAYIKGISNGQHSAYIRPSADFDCGECSLKQFFSKYAPAGDQNDPNSYANYVANRIGVNADTTMLSWIVANKLDQMADAIQIHEGWFVN